MSMPDTKTILLVEDETIIALAETRMLENRGYSVLTASTGEQALELGGSEKVDLVLMDIDLGGGMDGTEAARELLRERELPIIFLTSHSEQSFVERATEITGYGYVLKSAREFVLLQSIKMALSLFSAQQRTRESEEKYRAAFMTSPDSININGLDGSYLDINEGFTALTGYTRSDVIGKRSSEIAIWAIPEDREKLLAGLERDGVVRNLESLFRCKDGTERAAIMSARLITIGGEPHILSITRDVAEKRRTEKRLQQNEHRYRSMFDHAAEGILIGDEAGLISDANVSICEMSGYTKRELVGQPIEILLSEESLRFEPLRYDLVLKGESVRKERTLLRKDGSKIAVSMTSTKVDANCLQSIIHDVSDLREAERALRESEERFRLAVEGSRDGLWDWNLETNEAYHSSQFARMLGYGPGELPFTGEAWSALLHPEDREGALARVSEYLNGKMERYESAFRMRTKTGEYRWITGRGMAVRDDQGKPKRFVGFNTDITEQKEQEQRITSLLEEKEALLREINHRVKNNLAMIASLISLKNDSLGPSVDLSDIRNQIDAIRLVHEELHDAARASQVAFRGYAKSLLQSVFSISPIQPVRVETEIIDCLVPSKLAVSLGLILNELATNAVKHSFQSAEDAQFSVSLRRESPEDKFLLTVSNSGPPIEEKITLENSKSLGMRLVSALVDQIGGSVELYREPRTSFAIRFACQDAVLGPESPSAEKASKVLE